MTFTFSEPTNNAKNVYYDGQYIGFQDCEETQASTCRGAVSAN